MTGGEVEGREGREGEKEGEEETDMECWGASPSQAEVNKKPGYPVEAGSVI